MMLPENRAAMSCRLESRSGATDEQRVSTRTQENIAKLKAKGGMFFNDLAFCSTAAAYVFPCQTGW